MWRLPFETVCSFEAFSLLLTLSWTYTKLLSAVKMVFIHKIYKENIKKQPLIFLYFLAHRLHFIMRDITYHILQIALPKPATLHITQPIKVLWAVTRVGRKSSSSAYCISQSVGRKFELRWRCRAQRCRLLSEDKMFPPWPGISSSEW